MGSCDGVRTPRPEILFLVLCEWTPKMLTELGASSKLNAEWEFFFLLRDEGRWSAQVFLESHASDLGHRSTLDLDVLLEQSALGEQFIQILPGRRT